MSTAEIIQITLLGASVLVAVLMSFVSIRHWQEGKYLCEDCKYNDPSMCSKAERPKAVDCLAYVCKEQAKNQR